MARHRVFVHKFSNLQLVEMHLAEKKMFEHRICLELLGMDDFEMEMEMMKAAKAEGMKAAEVEYRSMEFCISL